MDAIVVEPGVADKLGRAALTGVFRFFPSVDEEWTLNPLAPLFDTEHEEFQRAWDGFLTRGSLSHSAVTALQGNFVSVPPRVAPECRGETNERCVGHCAGAMVRLVSGANDVRISEFCRHAITEPKQRFVWSVHHRMRHFGECEQREWWTFGSGNTGKTGYSVYLPRWKNRKSPG